MVAKSGKDIQEARIMSNIGGKNACQLIEQKKFNLLNWSKESTGWESCMGGQIQQTIEGLEWQAKDLGLYPSKERKILRFQSRQSGMLEMCFGKMILDHMQEGKD